MRNLLETNKQWWKDYSQKLLILLVIFFFSFLCIEGVTRVFICDNDLWQPDSLVGLIHISNKQGCWFGKEFKTSVTINNHGFIGDDFVTNNTKFRIVVLGDSFIEGLQVEREESFTYLLEKKLNMNNYNVEVYNFGVSDMGTAQEYEVLKNYALDYNPDMVILGFHTRTDFIDNSLFLKKDIYRPYYIFTNISNTSTTIVKKEFALQKIAVWKKLMSWSRFLKYYYRVMILSIQTYITNSQQIPPQLEIYTNYSTTFNESIQVSGEILKEMQKTALVNNASFVVVVLTNAEQVEPTVLSNYYAHFPSLSEINFNIQQPEEIMFNICETKNISCFSLLPSFVEYKNKTGSQLHYYQDSHWNKVGHALAAEEVTKYIISNNLIKQDIKKD